MTAVASPLRSPVRAPADQREQRLTPQIPAAPIVAAVDGSTASTAAAVETAVRLGAEMDAPLVFVYVRRGPPGLLGAPVYQRRLTAAMARARHVLDRALRAAARAGIAAEGEILEGSPRKRILEFARDRGARLVVVGRRRRRLRLRRSLVDTSHAEQLPGEGNLESAVVASHGDGGRLVGAISVRQSEEPEALSKNLIAGRAPTDALVRERVAGRSQ
jgi:nucleotide-binding universal stress UspA family protein